MAATAMQTIVISTLLCLSFDLLINNPTGCEAAESNVLYSNKALSTGESLRYLNRQFIMQEDCNLVLYTDGSPIWASNTGGLGRNCHCILQSDGNLVVYRGNTPIWASNTGGDSGRHFVLILQEDGNVVIYGPAIWATGTSTVSRPIKLISADEEGDQINTS